MSSQGTSKKKAIRTEVTELSPDENLRTSQEKRRWFKEGRCPLCGELGPFVAGAPVCSTHGPYTFVPEPAEDEGLDEQEMLPEEDG
ncbi:MAG: hypothetical protein FJ125_11770 [Deltaproteobacteria bacterium]|nr:hypothetical protein [Deltaproteobacteria bacterium]